LNVNPGKMILFHPTWRKTMQHKTHPSQRKSLVLLIIPLLTLVVASLACSSSSKPPVVYDDKSTLLSDCRSLQADEQTVSVSGELSIRDETTCVSTSDRIGSRCELVLFVQDSGGLDIWMPIGTHNGMDELPDLLGYNAWDLVVHGDNGERLGKGDQVTVVLEPFLQTVNEAEECIFLVKTVEAAKMEASGDQPMEGKVDVEFPINLPWYDTGIRVQKGQQIVISDAMGVGCNMQGSNPAWKGPYFLNGLRDFVCDANCVVNGANYGMLVARIGDGSPLLITEETMSMAQFTAQTSGTLYFTLNDCQDCYGDNEGEFHLVLTLSTP
jgi:hypothetical protein